MLTTLWLMLLCTHGRNHTHYSSSGILAHCLLWGPLATGTRGSAYVPYTSITWVKEGNAVDGCYNQTDGARGWGLCGKNRGQGIGTLTTRTISRLGETWQDESIGPHHGGWSQWDTSLWSQAYSRGGALDIVLVGDPRIIITTTNPSLDLVSGVRVIIYYPLGFASGVDWRVISRIIWLWTHTTQQPQHSTPHAFITLMITTRSHTCTSHRVICIAHTHKQLHGANACRVYMMATSSRPCCTLISLHTVDLINRLSVVWE